MSDPSPPTPHYRRIAELLRLTLTSGALRTGDRIISARKLAEREQVKPPSLVIVGDVVKLHRKLSWFTRSA